MGLADKSLIFKKLSSLSRFGSYRLRSGEFMNILFIEPHLAICGGIRRIHELANGLVELGHKVYVSVPDYVFDLGQTGGWMKKLFEVIPERKLPEMKFEISIFNEETQYPICRQSKAPARVFYALHWPILHKDINTLRNCYNGGFHIIANSNWTADNIFLETGKRPPVHFGGLDHSIFHPVEIEKEYDIINYGASRLWKGSYIAEEVASILKISLFKFGDNSGIQQSKMAEAYSKARVYLSTSWYEGWNWLGLEAMACGVPVVISMDGGSSDYAKHGYNCLKYPTRDTISASEMVKKALENKEMRDMLIKNGLNTARSFSWKQSVEHFNFLLSSIYERSTGQSTTGPGTTGESTKTSGSGNGESTKASGSGNRESIKA